jgi:hypothetical protein
VGKGKSTAFKNGFFIFFDRKTRSREEMSVALVPTTESIKPNGFTPSAAPKMLDKKHPTESPIKELG